MKERNNYANYLQLASSALKDALFAIWASSSFMLTPVFSTSQERNPAKEATDWLISYMLVKQL